MRRLTLAVLLLVGLASALGAAGRKPVPELPQAQLEELTQYLQQHWTTPEDYVISKFRDHDVVFLGERHKIRHDTVLVQDLIPRLYAAGVYNLGIEFGANEFQDRVDRLINAENYDEDLARWLMFHHYVMWGFQEYMDLYRAAWKLNRSLPAGAPRFRVVNLNYTPRWELMKETMTLEDRRAVWYCGEADEFMGNVILREFVDRGQKALIYSGSHHAFTRYHQPVYDVEQQEVIRFIDNRMGNIVYNRIGDRAFNIVLHYPWPTPDYEAENYPIGGAIDRVMMGFQDTRVGFDVRGTPFGQLRDTDTLYAQGYPDFKLEDFCDGYIFQRHFRDCEGATVDPQFITESNFQEAVAGIPNLETRNSIRQPSDLIESMNNAVNMQRQLREFE